LLLKPSRFIVQKVGLERKPDVGGRRYWRGDAQVGAPGLTPAQSPRLETGRRQTSLFHWLYSVDLGRNCIYRNPISEVCLICLNV
jgi:hypothetical protein